MNAHSADTLETIRTYRPNDLEACRDLWVELTEWHRHIYESPAIGGDQPGLQFDEHLDRVGAEHLWVAEIDGRVVGLAGLIPGEGSAELEPVVVSAPYRRLGIGRRLAEAVMAAARTRGVAQLTVRPVARNVAAIRFFHRLGFDVLGHLELFIDFAPAERQMWKSGEQVAERAFRV